MLAEIIEKSTAEVSSYVTIFGLRSSLAPDVVFPPVLRDIVLRLSNDNFCWLLTANGDQGSD